MLINGFKKINSLFRGLCKKESDGNFSLGSTYIPFELHSSIGGPATFLKNLHEYLDKVNFPYVTHINKANVILFPISYDLRVLEKFKARGGIICQRLDGVYYPEKHGQEYIKRNEKIKEIYLNFSDYVIYQSEYSRRQCFDMFGEKPRDQYSIIINGVNTDIFHPGLSNRFNKSGVKFCTTGNIRNIDMFDPVIKALDIISKDIDFTFHVVGPIKNEECAALMDRPYIVHHGNCNLEQVAEILRSSDVFIYSHLNPPCPNSVLEAIASGLPVVGFDSGAMAELLPFSADLLAATEKKLYHSLEDFSPELLGAKLLKVVNEYTAYKNTSLQTCKNYSMDNCGRQYVEVMEGLMKRGRR